MSVPPARNEIQFLEPGWPVRPCPASKSEASAWNSVDFWNGTASGRRRILPDVAAVRPEDDVELRAIALHDSFSPKPCGNLGVVERGARPALVCVLPAVDA
jgi:hypothetical protein